VLLVTAAVKLARAQPCTGSARPQTMLTVLTVLK